MATTPTSFDQLWNFSDPSASELSFRKMLDEFAAETPESERLQLQTQIARSLGLQHKFDDGLSLLDSIAQASTGDPLVRVRWLLEKGRLHNSGGDRERSASLFEQAYQVSEFLGFDFYTVDAAHMLGIVSGSSDALKWNDIAVRIAEASEDERARAWLGPLYNNIGWTYSEMKEYDKALSYFERDFLWYEQTGKEEQARIARWSMAKMQRLLGRYSEAFEAQKGIARSMDALGNEPDGYVYEELGECALLLQVTSQEAASYFRRAGELLGGDAWFSANEPERAERLRALGDESAVEHERHKNKKAKTM